MHEKAMSKSTSDMLRTVQQLSSGEFFLLLKYSGMRNAPRFDTSEVKVYTGLYIWIGS